MIGTKKMKEFAALGIAGLLTIATYGCAAPNQNENTTQANEPTQETEVIEEETIEPADENMTTQQAKATAKAELANPATLEVTDSGWFSTQNNLIDFAVAVYNPNKAIASNKATLTVSGTDKNGNEIFTEDISIPEIAPQQTYNLAYVTGDSSQDKALPDNLSFTVKVNDSDWQAYDFDNNKADYIVEDNGASQSNDIEGVEVLSGTVTPAGDIDGQAIVTAVLYDKDHKMLGGYFDIVEANGSEPAPYEIYMMEAPQYDSYEIFAAPFIQDGIDIETVE